MRNIITDLADGYALIEESKRQSLRNFVMVMLILTCCLCLWGYGLFMVMDSLEGIANSIAQLYIESGR